MSELPLLEGVLNYIKENNISFCMPGHKKGRGFYNTLIGRKFLKNLFKFDITEVKGVDNLHNQKGIILEASKKLSNFYGSKKSYFLVNGSTSGNMIMIFASLNEGDKVIVDRNCHKSILNAIIMRKLIPVYVENIIDDKLNAPTALNLEHFLKTIENNKDAKAVIVTYPNYYGICSNLRFIIDTARKYSMKILVDSAHGAHFGICKNMPESAVKLGADMVVMSSHKTLPSFTQTAYLHVNRASDIYKADLYFDMFISTSPSYIAMCSMDYARFYLENYGKNDYENLIQTANLYRDKINSINGMNVLNKDYMSDSNFIWNIDLTRYVINLDKGYTGKGLEIYLRKNKIQVEMSDTSNIILILSPFNKESEFQKLYQVLKKCPLKDINYKNFEVISYKIPAIKLPPWKAILKKTKAMNICDAEGKICGKSIIPYPPGVPIICPGELIDLDVIKTINYYRSSNLEIMGLHDNLIDVIE